MDRNALTIVMNLEVNCELQSNEDGASGASGAKARLNTESSRLPARVYVSYLHVLYIQEPVNCTCGFRPTTTRYSILLPSSHQSQKQEWITEAGPGPLLAFPKQLIRYQRRSFECRYS